MAITRRRALGAAAVLAAASQSQAQESKTPAPDLGNQLRRLGHRNWIAIVDSAYPQQVKPGIDLRLVEGDQLDVVVEVLKALDMAKNVRPVIYLDAELPSISEADAPGISEYRTGLKKVMGKRTAISLPHEKIIENLDKAAETFKVLMLKTNLTLPYTSVFIQLECGYWSEAAEKRLREKIKSQESNP
ncbi:MAG: hypothetical protein ACKO23_17445 [Gemmataceae bacterium]